ncbi:hypothetical protein [Rhizobium paknamense]|uniref:Uncharacterized protein n=1 Tax=Rhizobium paknamense TaxID=1206817 RepID=A0ABU0I9W9_9HYPH|nr:hypothetical protein [Rhizobium paknamense]MDQ0455028.1 hypothetical protein [Rhizobium paknamense]
MSLHVSDLRGSLVSLLTEMGLMEPETARTEAHELPPLSSEQELLLACYRSGQMEEWAWQAHLDHDAVLADYWRGIDTKRH